MIARLLHAARMPSWLLHGASMGSVGLSLSLWIRAKTIDQDTRGNAERRAIFVGHWAPMFWILGDAVEREELDAAHATRRGWRRLGGTRLP